MEKIYNPQQIESHWHHLWKSNHIFQLPPTGKPYCLMLPPPNVTGTLHMGHGFQQTLMDALIRHARMRGYRALWQIGLDHAGIATQIVVEQHLTKLGINRSDLSREEFIHKVWEWKTTSGSIIKQQMERLGLAIDWSKERFSLDEGFSDATAHAFILLYQEGLIYRGKRLIYWDPLLNTAISDLEITMQEESGYLWFIRYPLKDEKSYLTVATTRPETLLGDVAVAVHPQDERYQHLIGKLVKLPLTDREIPIIGDESVDQTFGTGCLKITPAHDFNDYAMAKKHNLPFLNIFTGKAHLNETVPLAYQQLERFVARKKIISDLNELGLLVDTKPHRLTLPKGDRSGAILEPLLSNQWFVKTKALAQAAMEVAKKNNLKFIPKQWEKSYLRWLEQIEDWCISRQLWWGHQLPVWYDDNKNIYVGHNEIEIRKQYHLSESIFLHRETDVLDTWFSASLWPFATLGWPKITPDFKTFYPTDVLVTGFDILFFWVARMVMMALKLTGQIPFKLVYVTGLVRDSRGQKMSKSKGNILDPLDLIDGIALPDLIAKRTANLLKPSLAKTIENTTQKEFPNGIPGYGTDALRFTFCALANTGRYLNFDLNRIEGYRNFCNKLWNAARFVWLNTQEADLDTEKPLSFSPIDQWIQHQLQLTIQQINQHFKQFRFDLIAQTLYEFTWNDYCHWYLEFAKCVLSDASTSPAMARATRLTLLETLETLLRLLHPLMPFITEEIWQKIAPLLGYYEKSLLLTSYPEVQKKLLNPEAHETVLWVQSWITTIRSLRNEMQIAPSISVNILIRGATEKDQTRFHRFALFINSLAKVKNVEWLHLTQSPPLAITTVINGVEIHLLLNELLDKKNELVRLQKKIDRLTKEIEKISHLLKNPMYVKKAPLLVVTQEKIRLEELTTSLHKLQNQQRIINQLPD